MSHFVTYRNKRFGFCVTYPSDWQALQGEDSSGVFVLPPNQTGEPLLAGIEFGARVNQPSKSHAGMQTLEEIYTPTPDILPSATKVYNVTVISKKPYIFNGMDAIKSRMKYIANGQLWMAQNIVALSKDSIVYFSEMRCPIKECDVIRSVYERNVAQDFRLRCSRE
jgi:hypothetical protein